jgi:hypothetical protein
LADTPAAGAGRWTRANATWLRIAAAVLGVVVLLWGNNSSPTRLFWSLILVLALLAVIQVLVGVGRPADTGGHPTPPLDGPGDGTEPTIPLPSGGTA